MRCTLGRTEGDVAANWEMGRDGSSREMEDCGVLGRGGKTKPTGTKDSVEAHDSLVDTREPTKMKRIRGKSRSRRGECRSVCLELEN
jgi:hypothetical protein